EEIESTTEPKTDVQTEPSGKAKTTPPQIGPIANRAWIVREAKAARSAAQRARDHKQSYEEVLRDLKGAYWKMHAAHVPLHLSQSDPLGDLLLRLRKSLTGLSQDLKSTQCDMSLGLALLAISN